MLSQDKKENIAYYYIYIKFNKMKKAFREIKTIVKENRSVVAQGQGWAKKRGK